MSETKTSTLVQLREMSLGALAPRYIAASYAGGGLALATWNAVAINQRAHLDRHAAGLRFLRHFFDAFESIGLCLLGAAIALALGSLPSPTRTKTWPKWTGPAVYAALACVFLQWLVGITAQRSAFSASTSLGYPAPGPLGTTLHVAYILGAGLAIPLAHVVGSLLGRILFGRLVGVGLGVTVFVRHRLVLTDGYEDVHFALSWGAAIFLGAVLVQTLKSAEWDKLWAARPRLRRGVYIGSAVWLCLALSVPPPNRVRLALFRDRGAVAEFLLAQTIWPRPEPQGTSSDAKPQSPSKGRSTPRAATAGQPASANQPPGGETRFAKNPVIVLLTLDAVRGDVLVAEGGDEARPTFRSLKEHGAVFTHAISPGSQTAVSLTGLFTGRYFSQIVWGPYGQGREHWAYPATDPSPRLPTWLEQNHVSTHSVVSPYFLAPEFGIARGFGTHQLVSRKHAHARRTLDPLIAALNKQGSGPAFYYSHLMDAHEPYGRGHVKKGKAYDRYLSEIELLDREIGRVKRLLDRRFPRRGYLVISADHGEAFGEHKTRFHSSTLYQELIHVPLLIHGPGIGPMRIDERVGLIDVGPTISGLFGLAPPQEAMGTSLVPYFHGNTPPRAHPLAAEGRHKSAFFTEDGLKVIDNFRHKTTEVYDLIRDPKELHNLFDDSSPRIRRAVFESRTFFDKIRIKKPGYSPPYRR